METLTVSASEPQLGSPSTRELATTSRVVVSESQPSLARSPTIARRLRVGRDARWIELDGKRVVLARRRSPRLILLALVAAHRQGEVVLSTAELLAAGWPGEIVLHEAGRNRVYTAVKTLRRLGLGDCLIRYDDGYLIDPSVNIVEDADTV